MKSHLYQESNKVFFQEEEEEPKRKYIECSQDKMLFQIDSQNPGMDSEIFASVQDEGVQIQDPPTQSDATEKKSKLSNALKKSISQSKLRKKLYKSNSRILRILEEHLPSENIICGICEESHKESQLQSIGQCSHFFCESCIQYYIIFKVSNFENVTCPETECKEKLVPDTLIFKSLPKDVQKKFMKTYRFHQSTKNPALRLCSNYKCDQGVIMIPQSIFNGTKTTQYQQKQQLEKEKEKEKEKGEKGEENNIQIKCNKCQLKYCAQCILPLHEGSCAETQAQYFRNSNNYRQCKKCKNIIEKNKGCNHMTCRCGYQFCYLCGDEWTDQTHLCEYLKEKMKKEREERSKKEKEASKAANCHLKIWKIALIVIFFVPIWLLTLCILLPKTILKFIAYIIASICGGITFYTCLYIWKRDNTRLSILLTLFYPFIAFIGIGIAFLHLFNVFILQDLHDMKKLTELFLLW